jgi:peptidoglycan biosynthesis protein MviN/MurJ (putative lipid II flippase)
MARAFYATKNTTIPVVVSVLGIIVAIPGGYILSFSWGVLALPLAFFAGSALELVILLILIPARLKKIQTDANRQQS